MWQVLFVINDNFSKEDKIRRHFLLIGGFLGAGKTTLIGLLSNHLEQHDKKVALITNDQGEGLMDTASARHSTSLKQIEEAEWLIVNKCDLLDDKNIEDLKIKLKEKYPEKKTYFISAKTKSGLEELFTDLLTHQSSPAKVIEMDYERYAEGEAMLGWVNLEAQVILQSEPGPWLLNLGQQIASSLSQNENEVGHFKMSLTGQGKRWRIHQVVSGEEVQLIEEPSSSQDQTLQMLVNLRAEGDAQELKKQVHHALETQSDAEITFHQQAAFQPGKPEPTHRLA
jgi:G3E family GTPase